MYSAAELATKSSNLMTLPDIYLQLLKLIHDKNSTVQQMADLINLDAGLTARLLRIANSSFYSFPSEIDSVHRAITVVGSRELSSFVLATSVASSFKGISENLIDMDSFWRHNVDTGIIAHYLGKKSGLRNNERLFVAGLLHNIGKMVVLGEAPELGQEALRPENEQIPWEHEQKVMGFTFADCGRELLSIWKLPDAVVESVACQHDPANAKIDPAGAAIVHIANRAASFLEQEVLDAPTVDFIALIDPAAWDACQLSRDDLEQAIEFAQLEAWNILSMITTTI